MHTVVRSVFQERRDGTAVRSGDPGAPCNDGDQPHGHAPSSKAPAEYGRNGRNENGCSDGGFGEGPDPQRERNDDPRVRYEFKRAVSGGVGTVTRRNGHPMRSIPRLSSLGV